MTCRKCANPDGGMAFECIKCCVRWLSGMTTEEMEINAPVITAVMGEEHMEKVRKAWKTRKK
jgi:hypothetical protein